MPEDTFSHGAAHTNEIKKKKKKKKKKSDLDIRISTPDSLVGSLSSCAAITLSMHFKEDLRKYSTIRIYKRCLINFKMCHQNSVITLHSFSHTCIVAAIMDEKSNSFCVNPILSIFLYMLSKTVEFLFKMQFACDI